MTLVCNSSYRLIQWCLCAGSLTYYDAGSNGDVKSHLLLFFVFAL
jgi:hypothetical protein